MPHKSAGSPYINHFLQPDTIIPDYTNPQSWNRYAYVMNSPIGYNDPTGHCPVCGGAIGAMVGAIAGAALYTYYNQKTFNVAEYETAVVAGATAGGLIGSGIGVIAAPEATVAAIETATSVISAGTSATVSGGNYIVNNPDQFETRSFAVNTSTSAATAYFNSSSGTTGWERYGISLVGAEANYLMTTKTQNPKQALDDMANVVINTAISRATTESLNFGSSYIRNIFSPSYPEGQVIRGVVYPGRLWDSKSMLSLAASERTKDAAVKSALAIFNGIQTGRVSSYVQKVIHSQ